MDVEQKQSPSAYAWFIWFLGAFFFFIQYFPRVIPSITVCSLMRDFHVTAFAVGGLSAYYLIAYIGMQLPVGLLYDKLGAKKLLFFACLIASLGAFLFGEADLLNQAKVGRFLTGFGGAFAFIGAMKLANMHFPSSYYGLLAGFTQGAGMLGAALGEAPTVVMISYIGWRGSMYVFSIIFAALALLILIFVREKNNKLTIAKDTHPKLGFFESLWIVMKNPQSWLNAFYLSLTYAPIMAFAELWGVNFLQEAYPMSHEMAAFGVGLAFIGWAIGGPILGKVSDNLGKRRPLMFMSSILGAILLFAILFFRHLHNGWIMAFLFLFGFTNTGVGISYALSIEINEKRVGGTSIAFANLASILLGGIYQPLIGWFLDLGWNGKMVDNIPVYSVIDYQKALFILPVGLLIGLIFVFFIKETHCKQVLDQQ